MMLMYIDSHSPEENKTVALLVQCGANNEMSPITLT